MKKNFVFIKLFVFVSIVLLLAPSARAVDSYSFVTIDVPDSTYTYVQGINNDGTIVGFYGDENYSNHGFIYDGIDYETFDMGSSTHVMDINDSGVIVGRFWDESGIHSFIDDGMGTTYLDYPDAISTEALGINNSGDVVGIYRDSEDYDHAFLYNGSEYTTLDNFRMAHDITDDGSIVGHYMDQDYIDHGLYYDGSDYTTLDYPGADRTWAMGMNNAGIIVGDYDADTGHGGYIYDGAGYYSFNYPGEISFTAPVHINDSNTIVGFYEDGGTMHGFVATATVVPEPISSTLFLVGAATLGFRRMRKKRVKILSAFLKPDNFR